MATAAPIASTYGFPVKRARFGLRRSRRGLGWAIEPIGPKTWCLSPEQITARPRARTAQNRRIYCMEEIPHARLEIRTSHPVCAWLADGSLRADAHRPSDGRRCQELPGVTE